ncbi:MAG: MFS transporter [Chitinophagales bacterium]|nr:MFS transporter [Chitinophagales bacterium]
MSAIKRNPILAVFITVFIDMLGVGIIIPIFAPLIVRNEYGLMPLATSEATRNLTYGVLSATFAIFQFFGAPILGGLADKYGRKKILRFSLLGTFVGYVLFALAVHYRLLWLVFIARALPGFMGGNISIVLASLADISDPKDRAKNFGLVGMAFGLGFILGPFIGGTLGKIDLALPLWCTAALTLLNIVLVVIQFPETFVPSGNGTVSLLTGIRNVKRALKMKELDVVFLTLFLQAFGFSFFMQFFQVYLIKQYDFSQVQIGQMFGYIGIWIAITQGGITRLVSKRFSSPQILQVTLLGLSLSLWLILGPSALWMLFVTQPLVALFQGLSQPNLTSIVSVLTPKDTQGEILGIQQSVQSLAFAIPPIIAGVVVSIDVRLPIFLAGLSIFIAWLVFVFGFRSALYKQKVEG